MRIRYFCPLWGGEKIPFRTFIEKVCNAGFDGVEMGFPVTDDKWELVDLLKEYKLDFIAQHWQTNDKPFGLHYSHFDFQIRNLASLNPLFINTQTGKDYYTVSQNEQLLALAETIQKQTSVSILHETHRGRFAFGAHVAFQYLNRNPDLRLCLDISHWCCVAESMLEDQQEAVDAALRKTLHLHARVGHPQGPQVMDPRSPENLANLKTHLQWWRKVVEYRIADGSQEFTITPEFGAPPYLQLLPYSEVPVADQWDVNVFMMRYLRHHLEDIAN